MTGILAAHATFNNNMGGGSALGLAFVGLFILWLMRDKKGSGK